MKKLFGGLVLAAGIALSSGCAHFNNIPDDKIECVREIKQDAEWANKYKKYALGENLLTMVSGLPFDKMTPDELVQKINTPYEAQLYSLWLVTQNFPWKEERFYYTTSLPVTHRNALSASAPMNDCSESAAASATLLYDNGFKPLMLKMCTRRYCGTGHVAFLYRSPDRKFHIIDSNYRNRKFPEGHDSVNELVKKEYPEMKEYSVYDISEIYPDWQTTEKNMQSRFRATTERMK
jgi:hypothetical protein